MVNEIFTRQTGYKLDGIKGKLIEEVLFQKGKKDSELAKIDAKRNALVTFYSEFTSLHADNFKLTTKAFFHPIITEKELGGFVIYANFQPQV